MKDTTLIMTTWNAFDHVKYTLKSLYENTKNFDLILFDNGSERQVQGYLRDFIKERNNVELILSDTNIGVWKSRNEAARRVKTPFLGIIDSDIAFQSNWLTLLKAEFRDPKLGQVGPLKLFSHLNHPIDSRPLHLVWRDSEKTSPELETQLKFFTGGKELNEFRKDIIKTNPEGMKDFNIPPHCVSGCCMLTKTELFLRNDIIDSEYAKSKYGFEDMDYSWSLVSKGYKVKITPEVYIHHFEHSSVSENKLDINAEDQQYNTAYFYNKWQDRIIQWIEEMRTKGKTLEEVKESFLISIMYKAIPNKVPESISIKLKQY